MKNRMKERLNARQPVFGVSVMFASPNVVDMVGRLGFDWVLIDCEHGSASPDGVEMMVMAAEAAGITPVARPPVNSPEAILRVLDRGALGVQVPHVSTADDARRAVEAVKYHPLGERGLGAGIRSAGYGFGVSMQDYTTQANRETLVCVQLEDTEALRNLDQILLVEGVDVFFLGPSDLAQSMGYPGQVDAPAVQAALKSAFATIVAAGKAPGSAGNAAAASNYLAQGALYLYTHLTTLLADASNRFLTSTKGGKR